MEFSIEKKEGWFIGWIGYILVLICLQNFEIFDFNGCFVQELEGFGFFNLIYDCCYDIFVVVLYELSKCWMVLVIFVYGLGDLMWLFLGWFMFQDVFGVGFEVVVFDYWEWNNFWFLVYYWLDLGLVYKFFLKWGESDFMFSVVNVYDCCNVFFIFFELEFEGEEFNIGGINILIWIVVNQVFLFLILFLLIWNF